MTSLTLIDHHRADTGNGVNGEAGDIGSNNIGRVHMSMEGSYIGESP